MPEERLQKIIAAAGVASRRKAEELITGGRVTVNGSVMTELGSKADPESDDIRVDGKSLKAEQPVYILLHKPKGYVTTVSDPEGRPTVMDLIKTVPARVYPVGRLDYLSEGLLLLTNDGAVAARLTHASTHVAKKYQVKVSGHPTDEQIDELRHGVQLPAEQGHIHADPREGGRFGGEKRRSTSVKTSPCTIELTRDGDNPWYEVTLTEGRNRQIRRMFDFIGHHVEKIKRVEYGPLQLDVENGEFRMLTPSEVAQLKLAAEGKPERAGVERPRGTKSRGERPAFGRGRGGERKPFQKGSYVDRSEHEDARKERTRTARFDAQGKREAEEPRERFERPRFPKREEGGRPAFRGRRDDVRGERPFRGKPGERKESRGKRDDFRGRGKQVPTSGYRPPRDDSKEERGGEWRARGPREDRGDRPFRGKPAGGERGGRPFREKPAGGGGFRGKSFGRPDRGEGGDRPRGGSRFGRAGAATEGRGERPFRGRPAGGKSFGDKREDRPAFRGGSKEGGRREGGSRPPRGDRFGKKPGGFRKDFRRREEEGVPKREEPRSQDFVDNVAKRFAGGLESKGRGPRGEKGPRRGAEGRGPKRPFRKPKDRR